MEQFVPCHLSPFSSSPTLFKLQSYLLLSSQSKNSSFQTARDVSPGNKVKCNQTLNESLLFLNSMKRNCNCITTKAPWDFQLVFLARKMRCPSCCFVNSCSLICLNNSHCHPHSEVQGKQQTILASLLRPHASKFQAPQDVQTLSPM